MPNGNQELTNAINSLADQTRQNGESLNQIQNLLNTLIQLQRAGGKTGRAAAAERQDGRPNIRLSKGAGRGGGISAGRGIGAAGGNVLLAVGAKVAEVVGEAIKARDESRASAIRSASGLDNPEAVAARANIQGTKALTQFVQGFDPFFGKERQARTELALKQATEPQLRTIQAAEQQTFGQFQQIAALTGQAIDESTLQGTFQFFQQRQTAVTETLKRIKKISGEQEKQVLSSTEAQRSVSLFS